MGGRVSASGFGSHMLFQISVPHILGEKLKKMTEAADEAFMRRLQFLARSLRRRNEPAIADDLEAVIRFTKSAAEEREEALWRDPGHLTLIRRLEKRAEQARTENQSLIASDLDAAVELIRRLRALG